MIGESDVDRVPLFKILLASYILKEISKYIYCTKIYSIDN